MQSRVVADDSRVGEFAVNDATNSELSACPKPKVNCCFVYGLGPTHYF